MTPRILRTPQAAGYVGLSESSLEKKRLTGDGPDFVRLGPRAIGYDIRALDEWIDQRGRSTRDSATRTNDSKRESKTA